MIKQAAYKKLLLVKLKTPANKLNNLYLTTKH